MAQTWGTTNDYASFSSLSVIYSNILNIAIGLAGIILFIILVMGGMGYLTSGGNPEKTKKAGAMITSGIVGFIFLFLSWFILRLISSFTGIDLTNIQFPS